MRNDLRKLREERDLSGEQLANAMGVSKQNIHAIETGKYNPSLELAIRLARHFRRPVEEIFHVDQPDPQPDPQPGAEQPGTQQPGPAQPEAAPPAR